MNFNFFRGRNEIIDPNNVNPDRIRINKTTETNVVPPEKRYEEISEVVARDLPPEVRVNFDWDGVVRRFGGYAALASAILAVGTNIGREASIGKNNESLTDDKKIEKTLETTDVQTLVKKVQDAIDNIDINFMHRFTTRDADGNESFNPGAFIIPFAVEVAADNKVKTDIEINIPYHFARTFKEVSVKNPEAREEMIKKLSDFIKSEAQNQLVIRGVAGVTDTTLVYNAKDNILLAGGKPKIDLGKFDVDDIKITGKASAEAEKSAENPEAQSLSGENKENIALAADRLGDSYELIIEAMKKAGLKDEQIKNIETFSVERNLVNKEISELAEISRKILGRSFLSDEESAYELIQEINKGNSMVIDQVQNNPEFSKKINEYVTGNRSIEISFTADVAQRKAQVFNIPVVLPMIFLLFPKIKIRVVPGGTVLEVKKRTVRVPDKVETVEKNKAAGRRLFSEVTPSRMDKERDFNEIYDSINLSEHSRDTHILLQHMLLEEVYPSFFEETREPLIDYEAIANSCRPLSKSNTRSGGTRKGEYSTRAEMQREISKKLLDMWESHDMQIYPMKDIDIRTVLNYAHSEDIVYWAKTLAETFTELIEKTNTTEEFRNALLERIRQISVIRRGENGADRNVFVASNFPERQ